MWNIVRKVQVEFAACNWFGSPSSEVIEELKKQGWQFDTHIASSISTPFAGRGFTSNAIFILATTPEGKNAHTDRDTRKSYRDARYQAARKIYGYREPFNF